MSNFYFFYSYESENGVGSILKGIAEQITTDAQILKVILNYNLQKLYYFPVMFSLYNK